MSSYHDDLDFFTNVEKEKARINKTRDQIAAYLASRLSTFDGGYISIEDILKAMGWK